MPIILVPTSHIAAESIQKIKETVEKEKPDCIAVELDKMRYHALKEGGSNPSVNSLGLATYLLFYIMRKIQQDLGDIVGLSPGSEMLRATEIGQKNNIPVAFIDQPIDQTFLQIKLMPFREKTRLIKYLVAALFTIKLPFKIGGEKIDMTKVPKEEIVDQAIEFFEKKFPVLYKILVEDRNKYMAKHVRELSKHYKKIVVVIGAGHRKGLADSVF